MIAFLASPFAPSLVITIGAALVAWAAFQAKSEGAAATVVKPESAQRSSSPAAPVPAAPSVSKTSAESYAPLRSPGARQTKITALTLTGEIRAWADSWDARPAIIGSDFEMASEFRARFGDRLEALKLVVPTLSLYEG